MREKWITIDGHHLYFANDKRCQTGELHGARRIINNGGRSPLAVLLSLSPTPLGRLLFVPLVRRLRVQPSIQSHLPSLFLPTASAGQEAAIDLFSERVPMTDEEGLHFVDESTLSLSIFYSFFFSSAISFAGAKGDMQMMRASSA